MGLAEGEDLPLAGIRVLDFGRYIAGPYCASLLADMGADVIRIERLGGSEDRFTAAPTGHIDGPLFLQLNRNKRCMTLNPMKTEGRALVKKLVETADIVIANVPPDASEAMGLDYATLRAIKADIIVCHQTAFGDTGPYKNRPGYDAVAQAMCASAAMTGTPGHPIKAAVSWVDYGTGVTAAFGTMVALMHRARTGKGQEVKANLLSTAMNFFHYFNLEAHMSGRERPPLPNQSYLTAPSDLFRARDGSIMVSVMGQPMFERWCALVGDDHWLGDPRYATDQQRGDHAVEICAKMQEWVERYTVTEALSLLEEARISGAPVLMPFQALGHPQVREMGIMQDIEYPGAGIIPLMKSPVTFNEIDVTIRTRPPLLGEHTNEVLEGLGYSTEEIAGFRARRVV